MASNNKLLDVLGSIFGNRLVLGKKDSIDLKVPNYQKPIENKDGKVTGFKFDLPNSELQKYWDFWIQQCHDNDDSFRNIMEVYADMDYMYYNSTIYSRAVELYADEVVQVDSQLNPVEVYAKDKRIEKELTELFTRLRVADKIRATARSIVHKGNACWILGTNSKIGVTDITQIKVEGLSDIIQFIPIEVENSLFSNQDVSALAQNNLRMKKLLMNLEELMILVRCFVSI
jgi:hypothetical protein